MPLNPDIPITEIMVRTMVTAPPDVTVDKLIELMTSHHVGCIPIVDNSGHPSGIVTKLDLVECRDRPHVTAREIMMPHAMSIPPTASVGDTASLMSAEGFHHVLVVDANRSLVGVVSTFDITQWVARGSAT